MSTSAQGRQNRGYGKPTSSQYPAGNRYGNREKSASALTNRRENTPSRQGNVPLPGSEVFPSAGHEDICVRPPQWLDSYLQDFKRKLIGEITDDIMKALDASYKNDVDKRRFKSSYFALKKRLTNLEAQRNANESQYQNTNSTAPNVDNGENKFSEEKSHEKHYRPRNGRNGNYNRRFIEPIPSSPGANVSTNGSPPTSKFVDSSDTQSIEKPKHEQVDGTIAQETALPNLDDAADATREVLVETIEQSNQDGVNSSPNQTTFVNIFDETAMMECTKPLKEIFKLLVDDKSDAQNSSTTDRSDVGDIESDKSLCKKVQSILNKLTPENFDVLSKQVKDLDVDTLEKQQEVVNVFVDRAINETLYSVVYAQMCKKFAVEHDCLSSFRELLIERCEMKLKYHEAEKVIRMTKMIELHECNDEEKVEKLKAELDQKRNHEFIGAILFMGELYNQELLTGEIMEKCFQSLLQNGTEMELEYLCHVLVLVGKNFMLREKSIATYTSHLVELRETGTIGTKLITSINSVIELMVNNWEPLVPDVTSETTESEDTTDV